MLRKEQSPPAHSPRSVSILEKTGEFSKAASHKAPQSEPRHRHTRRKPITLEYNTTNCNQRTDEGLQPFRKDARQLENRNKRVKNCGKSHLIIEHVITEKVSTAPMRCKSLSCPHCATERKKKIISQANYFVEQFPESVMMTLTLTNKIFSNDKLSRSCESSRYINHAWKKFRALLWKRKIRFKFFRVIEYQKNGTAHIHCIISHNISKHIVKAAWKVATNFTSHQVCVGITNKSGKTIRGGAAASYMVKYIAKMNTEDADALYISATRLVSRSIKIFVGQRSKLTAWKVHDVAATYEEAIRRASEISDMITDHRRLHIIHDEPPPF